MKAEFIVTITPEILQLHSRGDIARALSATVRRLRLIGSTKENAAESLPGLAADKGDLHAQHTPAVK